MSNLAKYTIGVMLGSTAALLISHLIAPKPSDCGVIVHKGAFIDGGKIYGGNHDVVVCFPDPDTDLPYHHPAELLSGDHP